MAKDWTWSDQFIPEIKRIVGPFLLDTAPLELDRNKGADLVMLRAKNLTVACRVRRRGYSRAYLSQFTIRAGRPSGTKSEFDKIAEGLGDLMLYGFESSSSPGCLEHWRLIDLSALRAHLILNPDLIRHGLQTNADGTSFRWFDITTFPKCPPLVVGASDSSEAGSRKAPTKQILSLGTATGSN